MKRKGSIQGRFFTTVFMVMALTILTSILVTYFYFVDRLKQSQVKDDQAYLTNISSVIDGKLKEIMEYQKNVLIDEEIQQYMYKCSRAPETLDYADETHAERTVKKYVLLRDNLIVDIGLTDKDGKVIVNEPYYGDIRQQDWYIPFYEEGDAGFSTVHPVMRSTHREYADTVTFVTRVNYIYETGLYIGNVLLHIDFEEVIDPLDVTEGTLKDIILFDERGNLLYSRTGDAHEDTIERLRGNKKPAILKDQENYYLISVMDSSGWTLVGILPRVKVTQNMWNIMSLFILLILTGGAALLLITVPLIRSVTAPLTELSAAMKKVAGGDLETRVPVFRNDETGLMAENFNRMVEDIKRLLEKIVDKEKQERAIEMKLLMTEINPHFIYNTLDTIIYLARRANAADVVRVTRLFINILQYNIRIQPYRRVRIREEGNYIQNYISILEYRYNHQIDLQWQCEAGLEDCLIHQMLIYPLVENSVYHGIMPTCEKGTVSVKIRREAGAIRVAVEDDGMGIEKEKLEELKEAFSAVKEEYSKEHIGLNNVNMRLKLLYGETCGLNVESIEGEGAEFFFIMPEMREDK